MFKKLKVNNSVSYSEINDITYAFQIASGQGYAVGNTKGMLDFLKNYGSIHISDIPEGKELCIMTSVDLADLYLLFDKDIDLRKIAAFSDYF